MTLREHLDAVRAPLTVLVCGGRDYNDASRVWWALDALHQRYTVGAVVNGDAPGADAASSAWAARNGVALSLHPADWSRHGKAAGPIRNREMLTATSPHVVVAFPGGRGTADMCRQAESAGVPVWRVPARVAQ